jgi:hypothetical protein
VNEIEPILQAAGAGGGALAIIWLTYSKIRAMSAADGASAERSQAEGSLYETLTSENARLAKRLCETDGVVASTRADMNELQNRCDAERAEAFAEINKLSQRVDELQDSVNACQRRHEEREAIDEKGRTGQIDRRADGQAPRGRRQPPRSK